MNWQRYDPAGKRKARPGAVGEYLVKRRGPTGGTYTARASWQEGDGFIFNPSDDNGDPILAFAPTPSPTPQV